jgi:hypothetical protein
MICKQKFWDKSYQQNLKEKIIQIFWMETLHKEITKMFWNNFFEKIKEKVQKKKWKQTLQDKKIQKHQKFYVQTLQEKDKNEWSCCHLPAAARAALLDLPLLWPAAASPPT